MRCNAPKGALTPALKAQLSERKSEIVAFFQQNNTRAIPELQPVDRTGKLPLSFAQQRLWFLDQLEGQSATYNVPQVLTLEGELNTVALTQALNEVVQRHESLRTTFRVVDGEPVQVILPAEPLNLVPVDLQQLPVAEQAERLQQLAHESASVPFDLVCDRPIRIQLIKQSEKSHTLLVTMHHIISDGWSVGIFTQELSTLYSDFVAGKPSSLLPLTIQYVDFARWQRRYLQGSILERQLGYWRQQLTDAPDLLSLPTDHHRPAVQSYQGGTVPFQLETKTSEQLLTLGASHGSTLFMTLMAAYATLLYRYSQSEDIVIGSPIANRTQQAIEPLIGFFANTLPLRIDLSGEPTFLTLLKRIKPVLLSAYEYQDLPFEKLVEELNPERNLSYHPIFQVMFVLRNTDPQELDLPGIQLKVRASQKTTSKFDLTLFVSETANGLVGKWQYSTDLWLPETIQRLNNNFKTLLTSIVSAPQQPISQLPLLPEIEQQQLQRWNQTQCDYTLSLCVHQRFEAQTARTPDAVAVVFEETQLTYRQLNKQANQLAHYLVAQGITTETLVGICLHRSLEMIVAVFAVMKAGGAYVPIEPSQPKQRVVSTLAEAQPKLVLTKAALVDLFDHNDVPLVCLDEKKPRISQQSTLNLTVDVASHNLVYALYTSGSTGRPKGVMVEHRNLLNYIDAVQMRLQLAGVRHFATVSTLAADLGNTVVFPALCGAAKATASDVVTSDQQGGCLHILSEERVLDPNALAAYFQRHPVDCLKIVPSHLEALLSAKDAASVIPKQRLVLGGEPCSHALIQRIQQLAPNCIVFNHYGPTEATVGAIASQLPPKLSSTALPPLGRPLANVQIYILDKHQNSVPIGVPGEIYISGAGVARGYLNRPELTAASFIQLALGGEAIRAYKTGDLGRYNPDGSIEFVGRADNQVKIRGFRIELGDVAAALRQHPQVESAAVLMQGDTATTQQLVAYVVMQSAQNDADSFDVAQLSQFLKQQLPNYMVPSVFIEMVRLPFTANGKLDRQALPVPQLSDRTAKTAFTPPATHTERQLVDIWCECLNLEKVGEQAGTQTCEQIGAHDNFFELGGHSLLATQAVSRIRDRFNIELPLRSVFESPTITEMAALVDHAAMQQTTDIAPKIEPLSPAEKTCPMALSFAQQRLWFLDQLEGRSATYNVPTVLAVKGDLNVEFLTAALSEIVHRHEVLRTTFQVVDSQPMQKIAPTAPLPLPVVDLSSLSEDMRSKRLESQIEKEAHQPFDLSCDRPIRATLIALDPTRHVLMVTMHHIVSDGWSRGILTREISTLYKDFCEGRSSSLPLLPVQYTDFARWQRQWLQGETLDQQLSYWQQQLAEVPSLLSLPSDHLRPAIQTFNGDRIRFELSAELTTQLNTLSRQYDSTLFMTLLTAFSVLLHRYARADDIVVGSPIANRMRQELEPLIGFFVNTLILRSRITKDSNFLSLLQQTKQTALDAYAHQDLPFEKLVEALNPERNLSYHPIFQVMFILQNTVSETFDLPGVTFTPLQRSRSVSKFDLTLSLSETKTGMQGVFEYNSDLFEAQTVERMAQHFRQLLNEIVACPTAPVSQLSLLTSSEKEQLLTGWNDTQTNFNNDLDCKQLIHQQFEAQVSKTPNAIALVYQQQSMTYRELNERSQQLASYLQQRGVQPETLVGLCVERSPLLLVGLFGILKAGGAYVPIDPAYPRNRIANTLSDADVSLILTQAHLSDVLPPLNLPPFNPEIVYLDRDWEKISQNSTAQPPLTELVSADNLAYVIYTSGSTGKPKGVQITHGAVTNFLRAIAQKPGIDANDTLVAVTTIAFDISVLELFSPLVAGATVVLASSEVAADAQQLARLLEHSEASVMQATPATWQMLITDGWQGLPQLKILCGGEALSKELADQLLQRGHELWNLYGPTEATVWTAACEITEGFEMVPVAGPLANTQLYVLDEQLNPVPIGVTGEVHIGGAGLARGYLNQPELSAKKFIANPFSKAGDRLYKTGDLARFWADGSLSFLGRIDHQIKIRGFRIELGEVEAALSEHSTVQSCVVIAQEDKANNKRLVAYWVPDCSTEIDSSAAHHPLLKQYLKSRLPLYMVPSIFVKLEALPLTANGKIDRRALPRLKTTMVQTARYTPPKTEIQQQLTQLWQKVLALEKVGIHDNFFDLGGHSLLATQVVARIRRHFNIELPLSTLFQSSTIAQLAESLQATLSTKAEAAEQHPLNEVNDAGSLVLLKPGQQPSTFWVHPVGGSVFCYGELMMQLKTDHAAYGLQASRLKSPSALLDDFDNPDSINTMATDYIEQVRRVQPKGPYTLIGWSMGGVVAFEMAQQLVLCGEAIASLVLIDTGVPGQSQVSPRTQLSKNQLMLLFARDLGCSEMQAEYIRRKLSASEDSPLLALWQTLQSNHLIAPSMTAAELAALFSLFQRHRRILSGYQAEPYAGNVQLFECEQAPGRKLSLADSWQPLIKGKLAVYAVPGNHYSIMRSPHVDYLATVLTRVLGHW